MPRSSILRGWDGERKYRRSTGEMLCEGENAGRSTAFGREAENRACERRLGQSARQRRRKSREHRSILHRMRCSNSQVRWKRRRTSSFPASSRSGRRTRWTEPGRCSCWTAYRTRATFGTILRTAEAFALGAVVLCEGCADPFSPKVVRSTMGAVFRLPCVTLPACGGRRTAAPERSAAVRHRAA